jgi:hypothetical protein
VRRRPAGDPGGRDGTKRNECPPTYPAGWRRYTAPQCSHEQAALKSVYLAIMSLDPTGIARKRGAGNPPCASTSRKELVKERHGTVTELITVLSYDLCPTAAERILPL